MSQFPHKQFLGTLYEFNHLAPASHTMALDAKGESSALLHVTYSIHCFTEEFKKATHQEHHRYTYDGETRAFDVTRYNCSMQLPNIVEGMARAKVYKAVQKNYTYVAQIPVEGQLEPYSLFFTLKHDSDAEEATARMYVQSAYLKSLTVGPNATNWRFGSLLGQLTGVFTSKSKKTKPKKKAP